MTQRSSRLTPLALLLGVAIASVTRADTPPVLLLGNESAAYSDGANGLLINPALAGVRYPSELFFGQQTDFPTPPGAFAFAPSVGAYPDGRSNLSYGFFNAGGFGLGGYGGGQKLDAWLWSLAGGDEWMRMGFTNTRLHSRLTGEHDSDWRLGLLSRPTPPLSLAFVADHLTQPPYEGARLERNYTLALGLRPLAFNRPQAHTWGTRLTLTTDLLMEEGAPASAAQVRVGGEIEVLRGVMIRGSGRRGGYQLGVGVNLLRTGISASSASDDKDNTVYDTWAVSVHRGEERTVLAEPRARRIMQVRVSGELGDDRLNGFTLFEGGSSTTAVGPIASTLQSALEDPMTRGVLLEIGDVTGMAQVEELRPRIARLRAAGKPVVAYIEYGTGRAGLYLASACDRIVVSEESFFAALGLRVERRYYRRLLRDWGVTVDRASYGKYKSAYREFSADSTPTADREALEHNLDVSQKLFVDAVCADRRIKPDQLVPLLQGQDVTPDELLARGVIDAIGYREDARRLVGEVTDMGGTPRLVAPKSVVMAQREWIVPRRIAVIYASGGIQAGRNANDLFLGPSMGSESMTRQIDEAFDNLEVKAVVFRVDSPGGSSLASNLIHHALERAKAEHGKPLIVSMGDVAASGGYNIASGGDRIYADRFTRTGSIGVLTIKPSFGGWFDKHDVRQEAFERGRYMGGWSTGRAWTREEQALADSAIQHTYRRFVQTVADDRRRSWASIDSVAQGRVWMGDDAVRVGLVDEIGGLEQAIAEARRRAGIPAGEKIGIAEYRRPRPPWIDALTNQVVSRAWSSATHLPEPGEPLYWDDEWGQ